MVDGEKPGVDSRDEGKHTGRNDLLFVATMMSISRHGGLYTVEKSSVNLQTCRNMSRKITEHNVATFTKLSVD